MSAHLGPILAHTEFRKSPSEFSKSQNEFRKNPSEFRNAFQMGNLAFGLLLPQVCSRVGLDDQFFFSCGLVSAKAAKLILLHFWSMGSLLDQLLFTFGLGAAW